jgi:hypothetical protein
MSFTTVSRAHCQQLGSRADPEQRIFGAMSRWYWWRTVPGPTDMSSSADPLVPEAAAAPTAKQARVGPRAGAAIALGIYSAMAVGLFSNTWIHPTTWSIGVNTGDPQMFMWFLSWPPFAVANGLNPLFTDYQYFPGGVNLMWNTSMPLPALVLTPVTELGGPVLAYNVLMTAGLALSAWAAFLLIRRFVPSRLAACAGGAVYGFSPFMTAQSIAHPHLTLAVMPPILLLVLDEIVRVQRRSPVLFGSTLGLTGTAQILVGEELLAMLAVVAMLLVLLAIALRPEQARPKL